MGLGTKHLKFELPENLLNTSIIKLNKLKLDLKKLSSSSGQDSQAFNDAYSDLQSAIKNKKKLEDSIKDSVGVRALAVSLQSKLKSLIDLTPEVLKKIRQIKPKPTTLFIESIYQHYLLMFDKLSNPRTVEKWIIKALSQKGSLKSFHHHLFDINGPNWFAEDCMKSNIDFSNQLERYELQNYSEGRFLKVAKDIYFVNQLKTIPVNQPHDILTEVQKSSTYNSRYNNKLLLGHEILRILIERAPSSDIDESWMNVVMSIAGDPRVPNSHQNYIKWWSALKPNLNAKVRGWLSKLDLKLFLEALKNFSFQSGKADLKRMYPSRKKFLEGLLNKGLITNTRLYLSRDAASYLKRNYDKEHLPNFSYVTDGDRSIIHVQMGEVHIIEGSHSCYLWIYPSLDSSAVVFNYNQNRVAYTTLTNSLNLRMTKKGTPAIANITHTPAHSSWQNKAINTLNEIGVNITAQDVLSIKDYREYKRYHGV